MEGKSNAVNRSYLAIRNGLEMHIAQAVAHHRRCRDRAEVMPVPPAGVVAVPVRDERALYRSPGVNVHIRLRAVNTLLCEF